MTYIFNDSQKWQKNTTGLIRTWAGGLPYEQYLYGGLTLYLSHLPALIVFRDCRISCFLFNSSHICQFLNYVLHSRFFLAQRQVEDVLELSSCKESRVRCWIYVCWFPNNLNDLKMYVDHFWTCSRLLEAVAKFPKNSRSSSDRRITRG